MDKEFDELKWETGQFILSFVVLSWVMLVWLTLLLTFVTLTELDERGEDPDIFS